MLVMPLTIVQNTTGAIIILTILTNASPSGFSEAPTSGQKWPTTIPANIPTSTRKYRWLWNLTGAAGAVAWIFVIADPDREDLFLGRLAGYGTYT